MRFEECRCRARRRASRTSGGLILFPFLGGGDRLAGVVATESEVAVVQEDFHVGKVLETGADAFIACGGRVMHPSWSQGVGPECAALMVGDDGGLHRVLLLLPRDEGTASAAAGRGPADLDFGGVQPQLDAFSLGVREHIRQGPQPQAGPVWDRAPPLGQQPSYLTDRTGDRGAVDAEQQPQRCMRQIVPQMNQCGHDPVDEHQPMPDTRSCPTLPGPAASFVTPALDHGLPRVGQLLNQAGEMTPGDPREHLMRENRPTDHDRHNRIMPPTSKNTSPAITHQLVSGRVWKSFGG